MPSEKLLLKRYGTDLKNENSGSQIWFGLIPMHLCIYWEKSSSTHVCLYIMWSIHLSRVE